MEQVLIEHLLCPRHCTEYFLCMTSFVPHPSLNSDLFPRGGPVACPRSCSKELRFMPGGQVSLYSFFLVFSPCSVIGGVGVGDGIVCFYYHCRETGPQRSSGVPQGITGQALSRTQNLVLPAWASALAWSKWVCLTLFLTTTGHLSELLRGFLDRGSQCLGDEPQAPRTLSLV